MRDQCLAEVSWYVRSCLYQAGWQAEGKGSSQKKRCSSEAIGFRSWGQESLNQEVHSEAYPRCATLSFEREWLDKMDGVYANLEVTKKFSRQDALTMLSFGLGFHPRDPPVESAP